VKDPKRLVDQNGLGATLLASARSDKPRPSARDRAAAALGLSLVNSGATNGTVAAKGTSASLWLKMVAGGLVAVAIAGGAVVLKSSFSARRSTMAGAGLIPSAEATSSVPEQGPAQTEKAPPAMSARGFPPQNETDPSRGRGLRQSADPSGESPLARELKLLDAARAELEGHDPGAALAALDRYERAFPAGALRTEASMVRVEALLARGDGGQARKLARDLLAQDPSGPHARRLRSIVENP